MSYRSPADVREELKAHPRRALILTTVAHETQAVNAHLTQLELLTDSNGNTYDYGCFPDPAGDWLIVHALTLQGNSDAGQVTSKSFQQFGAFEAVMFVGVAGSLKEDIHVGHVVVGDYVHNAHAAKVGDEITAARPLAMHAAHELLAAAHRLTITSNWVDLLRAPLGVVLPNTSDYPCDFPPIAVVKGIASGEEVVASDESSRFEWIRTHLNNCGAVEMEGWGVMKAAEYENAPAIIVRGISDMCAGKDHEKDALHQPIAAAHAAAFAFSILSFRSKATEAGETESNGGARYLEAEPLETTKKKEDKRTEVVFSFSGNKADWPTEKVDQVVETFRDALNDENVSLIRIEWGSARLILSIRETDIKDLKLRELQSATSKIDASLLGFMRESDFYDALSAREALAKASADLLSWDSSLPNGRWMNRPESTVIREILHTESSSTVLLGDPGSGKSALLSKIGSELLDTGATVFALKADFLSPSISNEVELQHELDLPDKPSSLIEKLARLSPVYVLIDQLDALASYLDLRSGRLNVLLNLIRSIGGIKNVHLLLSARTFEFNHDVRLRSIEAEAITLELPAWHEVVRELEECGADASSWPNAAKDVIRIPQALKIFIGLSNPASTQTFNTYQAMLERLWHDRIASDKDSAKLASLASSIASKMAEEEVLWLAISRYDDQLAALNRLEALGLLVRSDNNFSVAFSHQTIFEFVLARTFINSSGLLSDYVAKRQDSLFVRAKLWSAINYLRGAEATSYERELLNIWHIPKLRRHLQVLLIDFMGQVDTPLEFEKQCMNEAFGRSDLRIFALKSIKQSSDWLTHFSTTEIPKAMLGSHSEAAQALQCLAFNWGTSSEIVVQLIQETWLPDPENDNYTWRALEQCHHWGSDIERIAQTVLRRTPISIFVLEYTAMALAVEQPGVAVRLVREKLDFLLQEARKNKDPSINSHGDPKTNAPSKTRSREFEDILNSREWNDAASLAEAHPRIFLDNLWPWYATIFTEILAFRDPQDAAFVYPGRYFLEVDLDGENNHSVLAEKPLLDSIRISIEGVTKYSIDDLLAWIRENEGLDILLVQQLAAHGLALEAEKSASTALDWMLSDPRRFQLGTSRGHRSTSISLVQKCAPYWTGDEIRRFENSIESYHPVLPDYLDDAVRRREFLKEVRATRKDLLLAVGRDRLSPDISRTVEAEERALGDQYSRSIGHMQGGWIGSPMETESMIKAQDKDILRIFNEVPDDSNWDHPTHWTRGGNIQLSRAFAEFSKVEPERAIHLIDGFQPRQQERAAAYALDTMAESELNDQRVCDAFLALAKRGFGSLEFRESTARAIEKIAKRDTQPNEEILSTLVDWLSSTAELDESRAEIDDEQYNLEVENDEDLAKKSIIWGHSSGSVLPGGNFNILSALAAILLNGNYSDRNQYIGILRVHLQVEKNPKIWMFLLHRLSNAGGSSPKIVSDFVRDLFDLTPELLNTKEAVLFFANAQRWDDQLVFDLIRDWPLSNEMFKQVAYGELVGLVAILNGKQPWVGARNNIIESGTENAKIGLSNAAVNLWSDERFRQGASDTLDGLMADPSKYLVAAVADIFRVCNELLEDGPTINLLRAFASPNTDVSIVPPDFIVEHLQSLLPHENELIATIAQKLVEAWGSSLGDVSTGAAMAAPQLTDLALTLHRLGGKARESGIDIFESMIEIDAYGASETLAEIDGRFTPIQATTRKRIPRRRKRKRKITSL